MSQTGTTRSYGGTAIYMQIPLAVIEGYPRAQNINVIEFTIIKTSAGLACPGPGAKT